MLIPDTTWERIREQFSDRERFDLRKAVTGQVLSPAGFIIEPARLDVALEFKIEQAMLEAKG